jgi:cytochrome P450
MEYSMAFLFECLRLYPPGLGVFPRICVKSCNLGNFYVPKGTLMEVFWPHRNPAHFKGTDEFRPDRWLNPDEKPKQHTFLPFSTGQRNCIGQHLA